MQRNSGYIPSPPDERDYGYTLFGEPQQEFPETFEHPIPPTAPYDQKNSAMCVAFSLAAIKEIQEYKERGEWIRYSPAFIYGNRPGDNSNTIGMYPRRALQQLQTDGVCVYDLLPGVYDGWGYLIDRITPEMKENAEPQKIKYYVRLNTPEEVKSALMNWGPVLAGAKNHAFVIYGWQGDKFKWLNSYGKDFGDNGTSAITFEELAECWGITDWTPLQYWRVQLGAFSNKENAEKLAQKIKELGFNAYITRY